MITDRIYNFLKSVILDRMYPTDVVGMVDAFFSMDLCSYNSLYPLVTGNTQGKFKEEELVDVALDHPEEFDVYYARVNGHGVPDFVIAKKGSTPADLWTSLLPDTNIDIAFDEFFSMLFRVDTKGDVSEISVAEEFGMPKIKWIYDK